MSNKKNKQNDIINNNVNKTKYENKIERVDFSEFHWNDSTQQAYYKGRKLTQSTSKTGYVNVYIEANTFRLHQLIAVKYIQKWCESHTLVDHINENKADNRIINLRWINNSENMAKAYQLRKSPIKHKDYIYKVTPSNDTSVSFYFDKRIDVAKYIQRSERAVSFALDGTTLSSGGYFITRTELVDGAYLTGY